MSVEWTALDDLGRREAGLVHQMRRAAAARKELEAARTRTLASFDRFLAVIGDGSVDWTDATDEEAAAMADALDTIHGMRALVAGVASSTAPR